MNNKKTIMVVEDEKLLLQAITDKLKNNGYDVVSCLSGKQAIDYLANINKLPDIIWLDYYLKDTNGLEIMHKIKNNQDWKHIPVLIVSNSASPQKVNTMLELGAKKYILKAEKRLDEILKEVSKFV